MKTELKKELQNAQNNRSFSGVGFGNLSESPELDIEKQLLELDQKRRAVISDILHTSENIQIPELTPRVKEVILLAQEIDPDWYRPRRKKDKYGTLNSYLHSWKHHKEVMTECPISDDSKALLEFVPSLGNLVSRNHPEKRITDEKGILKWVELEEEEITEEMKVMEKWGKWIDRYTGDIELKCKLFLYNNALSLIKEAKKMELPINHGFELEMKAIFQDERKEYLQSRYRSQYRSHEDRLEALFNVLLSYLGHCQVANYLMNKLTEDLEFTRELLNKAIAIYKKGVKELRGFLKDFSEKITEKAQSFIMQLKGYTGEHGMGRSRNANYLEGVRVRDQFRSLSIMYPCFNR